jgi:signal transduction protein with GAF and PtsI domain
MAANPIGAFLLIGLGAESLSVSHAALAEIKKVIRSITLEAAREAAEEALHAPDAASVAAGLTRRLERFLDLRNFGGSWSLSSGE